MSAAGVGALTGALPDEAVAPDEERAAWVVGGAVPEAVVLPGSVEEVRTVLHAAQAGGLGVVPMGGGTDPGCEAPSRRFVVLSTRRLSGVEEYEPADLTVTARAGLTLEALDQELARQGQWLPVDPPLAPRRTFGGLVATGAAGPLGTAYGTPRDHVLGVHVVTGAGKELKLGGRVMKNVAGFDLVKLMVGSRGTLGVVVSATVRLFPRPATDRALVLTADAPGALLAHARTVATAPLVPASAVLTAPGIEGDGEAALVVRLQGAPAAVDAEERRLMRLIQGSALRLEGEEAQELLARTRDHAAGGTVVLRAAALPSELPAVVDALSAALPGCALSADVLTGRVRASLPTEVEPEAALMLRRRLEELGGTLVLTRAPSTLVASVPSRGASGRAGALGAELRRRFDPSETLSPGRFAP